MADANTAQTPESDKKSVVVIDIGKKYRRKHVRRLRKGRGRLMRKLEGLLEDLREDKSLGDNIKPIVVVVKQKRRKGRLF